jgi:dihydrofolate reductase
MAPRVTAIVAMDRNGVIGCDNQLPWHLSTDLQRFKKRTMGHTLVMGRKTYDSIGKPLPGRKTIVLTRNKGLAIPGVQVASDWQSVLDLSATEAHLFIVGGAEIYRLLLPHCDEVLVTRVLTEVQGDTYFPDWAAEQWECIYRESVPQGPRDQWPTEVELRVRPSTATAT